MQIQAKGAFFIVGMSQYFPTSGDISEWDVVSILYNLHSRSINGLLKITQENDESTISIEHEKIQFATTSCDEKRMGRFLLENGLIDKETYDRSILYMQEKQIRYSRALLELGIINHNEMWDYVTKHLKFLIFSLFPLEKGCFEITLHTNRIQGNISLNADIPEIIVEGIRGIEKAEFFESKLQSCRHYYVADVELLKDISLKPHEMHVFETVGRYSSAKEIISNSECLAPETKKILYMLLRLNIISDKKTKAPPEEEAVPSSKKTAFNSFNEALQHYNIKYVNIYKTLSKEIGPVALTILTDAINDVLDNTPSYFHKIRLNSEGSIEDSSILKAAWYLDFGENIQEFLKGLEEILHAEIYAIRKHLGESFEQNILKWIQEIGK